MNHLFSRSAIYLIQLYRTTVSPLRPPACRFTPTCSQYAVEALTEYGAIRGGWLAVVRLCKCGPWNRGGWDPIPERNGDAHGVCVPVSEHPAGSGPEQTRGARAPRTESETRV